MPDPPELPDGARPAWPPWHAPVALFGALGAVSVAGIPLLPVLLISDLSEDAAGIALLILLLVQDSLLVVAALILASSKLRLRPWHFGIRATRLWPTIGWTALAFALMLGFEFGYIELLQVDTTNVEELGEHSLIAGFAVATAVIVVAPVAEEIFFRGFMFAGIRSHGSFVIAALVSSGVWGLFHYTGEGSWPVVLQLSLFGLILCAVYERTGSIRPTIALHMLNNAIAFAVLTSG